MLVCGGDGMGDVQVRSRSEGLLGVEQAIHLPTQLRVHSLHSTDFAGDRKVKSAPKWPLVMIKHSGLGTT
jgi:hypothetical protein